MLIPIILKTEEMSLNFNGNNRRLLYADTLSVEPDGNCLVLQARSQVHILKTP
jgi:hypothetical protein